jgi:hypothetical protein
MSTHASTQEQQILEIAGSPETTTEVLKDILPMAKLQRERSIQGNALLTKVGPDGFTFEVWQELALIGGGAFTVDRGQWEQVQIFPDLKVKLYNELSAMLTEADAVFSQIQAKIEANLARREKHGHGLFRRHRVAA